MIKFIQIMISKLITEQKTVKNFKILKNGFVK